MHIDFEAVHSNFNMKSSKKFLDLSSYALLPTFPLPPPLPVLDMAHSWQNT